MDDSEFLVVKNPRLQGGVFVFDVHYRKDGEARVVTIEEPGAVGFELAGLLPARIDDHSAWRPLGRVLDALEDAANEPHFGRLTRPAQPTAHDLRLALRRELAKCAEYRRRR